MRKREFLDSRPGQVDVEEEEEDSEADDGAVEFVMVTAQLVEEQMSVYLTAVSISFFLVFGIGNWREGVLVVCSGRDR